MRSGIGTLRVGVVGAGLGGMSAAALLAKAGHHVDVYDRLPHPGGKAGSRTLGAYRFDTGPSLFTMPWVFEDFFASLGERMEDSLHPVPLEPICSYFYRDGTRLSSYTDIERFGREIERSTASTKDELRDYLERCSRIWDIAGDLFLKHSLHEVSTYLSRDGIKSILGLPGIDPFRTLHDANAGAFRDPLIAQLFDRYATYNGSDPYKTPATMRIVPHVEHRWGGWAVEGGIVSVPRAIEAAAIRAGARFHPDTEVERIIVKDGKTTGLRIAGENVPYDLIVSNADVLSTWRRLLDQPGSPEAARYERLEPSSSGLVFLWGIRKSFPDLVSNNIFFSADYRREFAGIFGGESMHDDPTIYINITSKTVHSDAPPGSENWFVLVNTPRNAGQDWEAIAKRTRKAVLARLSAELGTDIGSLIEEEAVITPADIERDTGSTYGSLYGIASNDRLSAFMRHPNRSRRIRGLYFTGGSVHPGGGMPLAVLSGTIAASLAAKYGNN
jgi:phytoene desaturase